MSFTRAQLLTEARALADAESDQRWSDTTVLRHLDVVFDREWGRILAAFPYTRVADLTPTVDSDGYIQKSDLSSGSGDSLKRFYRIIGLKESLRIYRPADYSDNIVTASLGQSFESAGRVYWWEGDTLRLSPKPTGTVNVLVSHRPQLPNSLSASDVTVTFPEPWEMLLAYGVAAQMLAKGGTETSASADLLAMADAMRDDMLADLSRREVQPVTWRYTDSRADWAG